MSFPRVLRAYLGSRPLVAGGIALFVLLSLAYSFSMGLRASRGASITGDEPFYLLTTQSLLQDGDLDLRQQYERESYRSFFDHPDGLWRQSVPRPDGRLLSPHDPGLSMLLLPGFALGGLRGAQLELLLLAALTFAMAYLLAARETGLPLLSWLVTATVGLSATPFVYATEVYPEAPAALCLVLALLVLLKRDNGPLTAVLLSLTLAAAAWLGAKYVPLAGVIGLAYLLRAELRGRSCFLALSGVSALAYVWFHLEVFGHLTAYSINTVYEGAGSLTVLQDHLAVQERAYRLYGLFIDRRFGIGRWAPLLLLLLPALPLLVSRSLTRLLVVALILVQLIIATFLAITMMGYWFPGRTLMAVLPLCVLPLALLVAALPSRLRLLPAGLAALSLATTAALVHSAGDGEVTLAVDPFDMSAPGFQAWGRLFPDYRAWSAETVLLTLAWLALLGLATGYMTFGRARRSHERALGRPAASALRPPGRLPAAARGRSVGLDGAHTP